MNGTSIGRSGRIRITAALVALAGLMAGGLHASISEPDHVLYGQVSWFGEPVAAGELTLKVPEWEDPIARYTLNSDPALGSGYALRVPMGSNGERIPGTARVGDQAMVFLDAEAVAVIEIGEQGVARRKDLDPQNLEGLIALSIDDISVDEGDAGEITTGVLTVSISEALENPVTFDWATQDGEGADAALGGGSCGAGTDFLDDFGGGTIAAGNLTTTVAVDVCGNDEPDGDRRFYVELTNLSANVAPFKTLGEVVILDDNTMPQLYIEDLTVVEPPAGGTRQAFFRVSLSEPWTAPVSVDWSTANGSASAGIDYVADSGTLNFAVGQQDGQIPVTVLANVATSASRDFFVNLTNPDQATLGRGQGRAVIVDSVQTLVHVETQQNGVTVTGMSDPSDLAVASPDGGQLYVASRTADELVVFARDAQSGRLTAEQSLSVTEFLEAQGHSRAIDGINGFAGLIVSHDGAQVYAVAEADDAVVKFDRVADDTAPDYGQLAVGQVLFNGDDPEPSLADPVAGLDAPRDLVESDDGENLYVAAAGGAGFVVAFSRDPLTGDLLFEQRLQNGSSSQEPFETVVQGISGASAVDVSADGEHVYIAGLAADAVALFNRNPAADGRLSFATRYVSESGAFEGFLAPTSLAVSPDDAQVYVAGFDSNSVAVLTRDLVDGTLSMQQLVEAGTEGVSGLEGPLNLTLSNDGTLLYVASASDGTAPEPGTLTTLRREHATESPAFGDLTFEEVKRNDTGGVTGLWGATGVAVSPDDAHVYVAARYDQAVVVFARDLLAPVDPTLESPTHAIETWSPLPQITMNWSGSEDLDPTGSNPGSGLTGYSVEFSRSSGTTPDTTIDVAQASDPHQVVSAPVADGQDHWFHLRSCDNAGNCSAGVSYGPMWVDATAPVGPTALDSTSHEPGEPAIPDNVIDMVWVSATDEGDAPSGLAGYSYVFNQDQDGVPNTDLDLSAAATAVSSDVLDDGLWYFHIRAIDTAGNAGPIQSLGPFGVGDDVTPPVVRDVQAVAGANDGVVVPAAAIDTAVTQLIVRFDKPMDAALASDLANFRLFAGTVDPATASCASPDSGDLMQADYAGAARQTVLVIGDPTGLTPGDYTLIACDALLDFNGNGLDGDGDGATGGHFGIPFTVEWDNLLPNPNFDAPLSSASWGVNVPEIVHDAATDIAEVATSGAVRIDVVDGGPTEYAASRCINLDDSIQPGYVVQARVRVDDPLSDPNPLEARASMTFHSGPGCGDTLQGFVTNAVEADTGGAWIPLSASVSPGALAGAGSVLVSLDLSFPSGDAFPLTAWFDNTSFFAFGLGELPTDPPQVTRLLSTHMAEYGDLNAPLPTEAAVTQLVPEFSRGVFTAAGGTDPSAANNVANYRLFDLGLGGDPDCSASGDVQLGALVTYQAAQKRAVLRLDGNRALPAGLYRFAACGSIRDFDDNLLDGDGDGTTGDDYLLDFEIATTNVLRNPNLDTTAGQWALESTSGTGEIRWSAADADGIVSSGALRAQHPGGSASTYTATQCVDVSGQAGLTSLGAHVLTNQAFGNAPQVSAEAVFFDQAGCAGNQTGQVETSSTIEHGAGQWATMMERLPELPSGTLSARVRFTVDADGSAPVDVWLDRLMLRFGAADVIFRNRFAPEIY
jgi:6-phosphogluconolactonase (cycloisomerase 2 family)